MVRTLNNFNVAFAYVTDLADVFESETICV